MASVVLMAACGGGSTEDPRTAEAYQKAYETVTGCTQADFDFIQQLAGDRIAADAGDGTGPATGLSAAELRAARDGAEAKYRELGCLPPR